MGGVTRRAWGGGLWSKIYRLRATDMHVPLSSSSIRIVIGRADQNPSVVWTAPEIIIQGEAETRAAGVVILRSWQFSMNYSRSFFLLMI